VKTCCEIRRKVVLILGPVVPEEVCGVPDSALVDYMRFDLPGPPRTDGRAGSQGVLGFRFCPWCGTRITPEHEVQITSLTVRHPEADEGEAWKNGMAADEDASETEAGDEGPPL